MSGMSGDDDEHPANNSAGKTYQRDPETCQQGVLTK